MLFPTLLSHHYLLLLLLFILQLGVSSHLPPSHTLPHPIYCLHNLRGRFKVFIIIALRIPHCHISRNHLAHLLPFHLLHAHCSPLLPYLPPTLLLHFPPFHALPCCCCCCRPRPPSTTSSTSSSNTTSSSILLLIPLRLLLLHLLLLLLHVLLHLLLLLHLRPPLLLLHWWHQIPIDRSKAREPNAA
jgi:hypothetical protein